MPACHQHTATGDADGTAVASGAIVASEAQPIDRKAIQMGRLNIIVTMSGDRVRTLIVGEQEDDVGAIAESARASDVKGDE